jgi:hypothetical protein
MVKTTSQSQLNQHIITGTDNINNSSPTTVISKYTDRYKKRLLMISLINDFEIIFVLIFLYYIGIFSMIGSALVTMATELFCLNKLHIRKFALLP